MFGVNFLLISIGVMLTAQVFFNYKNYNNFQEAGHAGCKSLRCAGCGGCAGCDGPPAEAVLFNEKLESISHNIDVPIWHATCQ